MKVSRNSWHFKVYRGFGFDSGFYKEPSNLCPYFWRVVWGLTKGAIIVALCGLLLFMLGTVVFTYPFWSLGGTAVIALFCAICAYWDEIRSFLSRNAPESDVPEPEPGLIRSYIKAKKDKVCPMIEVVE